MKTRTTQRAQRGFTIVELLIVIAILAVISTLILIQVDPARRIHQAHNATRWSDILSILESVKRYESDNDSALPTTTTAIDADAATVQIIGENVTDCTCTGQSVKASPCGISGLDTDLAPYLGDIPMDPISGSADDTRYYMNTNAYNIITIGACDAEGEESGGGGTPPDISIQR